MADLHKLFSEFNENISLTFEKSSSLKTSRDALRKVIKDWFCEKDKLQPKFCWQGSFAMKTALNPINGEDFDMDDGVYLQGYEDFEMEDWVTSATAHVWVKNAVAGRTKEDVIDKDTCVRVPYSSGYHIDLPIYIIQDDVVYLAHKSDGWVESDPKAFRDWFIEKVTGDDYGEQLRRIVKYLKAWRDYKDIPLKGVEITILAAYHFDRYDNRDDKSLRNTLDAIINSLETDFKCVKPVEPKEDLFEDFSETRQISILSGLKSLKANLDRAITEKDEKKASECLQRFFGNRFPTGQTTESIYASSPTPGVLRHDGRSA